MWYKAIWMPAALWAVVTTNSAAADTVFQAPLDVPAARSAQAIRAPLNALAVAGARLVAAGQRGHILYSNDGKIWTQAAVPVSSDLVALSFPAALEGWAVGHDGVVLHTADGGATWTKQLDRRMPAAVGHQGEATSAANTAASGTATGAEQGMDRVLLDVWFEDTLRGFAVGAFGLLMRTEDGGRSWTAWTDRADNPKGMHLYAIRPVNGELFIGGEQGLLLKLSRTQQRFIKVEVPYKGTLFGIAGSDKVLLVYGLRGNAFRSTDGGASWDQVNTGITAGLTGCLIRDDGSILLTSQAGHLLVSKDGGKNFHPVKTASTAPIFAMVAAFKNKTALAGIGGVRLEAVK